MAFPGLEEGVDIQRLRSDEPRPARLERLVKLRVK
jgi:hypothetical protein